MLLKQSYSLVGYEYLRYKLRQPSRIALNVLNITLARTVQEQFQFRIHNQPNGLIQFYQQEVPSLILYIMEYLLFSRP